MMRAKTTAGGQASLVDLRTGAGVPEARSARALSRQQQQRFRRRRQQQTASSPSTQQPRFLPPRRVVSVSASSMVERDHTAASMDSSRGQALVAWLEANGAPQQSVELREVVREGRPLDVAVAASDLKKGDRALSVPEKLVVTLSRVFEDGALAELLTTNKLSELACLALFLMYEKKRGSESEWQPFIKELDRIQARGALGAKSPLLWSAEERGRLLRGSPLLAEAEARVAAVEKEYEELDTVWFMAGSLFNRYSCDPPTGAFPLEVFKQAFAAVQASVVHLQGVETSRRFALVPMGPPLLTYSSDCRALLRWDAPSESVVLDVDRDTPRGEPVVAWCGPQPNRRLLLNYGIVDEGNPHDAEGVTVTLPTDDPLFASKRAALQRGGGGGGAGGTVGFSTTQAFKLTERDPLPEALVPYLRLAFCRDAEFVAGPDPLGAAAESAGSRSPPLGPEVEAAALGALTRHLRRRLQAYASPSTDDDDATIASEGAGPRSKVAARLLRIEKRILRAALEKAEEASRESGVEVAAEAGRDEIAVRLS